MEFPPGDWFIFEVVNFETAHPSGSCPAQVHPHLRDVAGGYSSTVWPVAAAIQSRHFINCVTFHGCYPVEIFSQQGGLSWLLSSRDLQSTGWPFMAAFQSRSSVNRVAIHSCYPVEIFSQQGGLSLNPLWCPSASAILMLSAKQIFKR